MVKRTFDILVSVLLLPLLLVPMLVIALMIRLGSSGKAIFSQRRAGWRGKPFTMLKFRTMRIDADPYAGSPHSGEDPRLTRLGRLLRETSLDELPQLFNVILGQMSLVGPRPERPHFVRRHKALREVRLTVKPGLTGLAQIRSLYDLHPKHKINRFIQPHPFCQL